MKIISKLVILFFVTTEAFASGTSWMDYQRATRDGYYQVQQPLNGPDATAYYRWKTDKEQENARVASEKQSDLFVIMECAVGDLEIDARSLCDREIQLALGRHARNWEVDDAIELAKKLGKRGVLKLLRSRRGQNISWESFVSKEDQEFITYVIEYKELTEALDNLADRVEDIVVAKILAGENFLIDQTQISIKSNPKFQSFLELQSELMRFDREYKKYEVLRPDYTRYGVLRWYEGNRSGSNDDVLRYFIENKELYTTDHDAFIAGYDKLYPVSGFTYKKRQLTSFIGNCFSSGGEDCKSNYLKELTSHFKDIANWVTYQEYEITGGAKLKQQFDLEFDIAELTVDSTPNAPARWKLKYQIREKYDSTTVVEYIQNIDAASLIR